MDFRYGLIEGFYGGLWSWEERSHLLAFLQKKHFGFYLYAPKQDPFLRESWNDNFPEEHFSSLKNFGNDVRKADLGWGVGFSPCELYRSFGSMEKKALSSKLSALNDLKTDFVAILFDDMNGKVPELASTQVELVHYMAGLLRVSEIHFCPTYYSDSEVLDYGYGLRPPHYLKEIGEKLDPSIQVYWTGPTVIPRDFNARNFVEVSELLRRKPIFWDNYPVNDTAYWSPYLNLKPFENRPYQMGAYARLHGVNPMTQPYLSQIPLSTLRDLYVEKENYSPERSFHQALRDLVSPGLAKWLSLHADLFQNQGLKLMTETQKGEFISLYSSFNEPAAKEVVGWLKGETLIGGAT